MDEIKNDNNAKSAIDKKHNVVMTNENAEIEVHEPGNSIIIGIICIILTALVMIVWFSTTSMRHKYDPIVLTSITSNEVKEYARKNLNKDETATEGVVSNPKWFRIKGKNDLVIMYPGSSTCSTGLTYDGYDKTDKTVTLRIDKDLKNISTPCTLDLVQYWYKLSLNKSMGSNLKIDKVKIIDDSGKTSTIKRITKVGEVL